MLGMHRSPSSWFARRAGRGPAARPHHQSTRRRLTLEPLEGRALLSLTTWTVNSLGDTGTGSGHSGDLRYCITQADQTRGDNTINFSVTGTITLYSPLPDLSNTTGLTDIEGPGAASLTVARSSAAGTPDFRIFTVDSGADVTLVGFTIMGGLDDIGGGIENSGTLTVTDSTIDHNSAFSNGVIDYGGGGIFTFGTLTVSNSTIANNSATGSYGSGGGIDDDAGTLTISNSTIANNSAVGAGGGIFTWFGSGTGSLTVTDSTIANNSATGGEGGGICNVLGTMTVTNSTIANNSATGGEGGGISSLYGTMTVTNSTIANNSASPAGGGLDVTAGTATLDNTIVALNTQGTGSSALASDISGSVSGAYNLIGTGGSGGLVDGVNGNQVGVANPGLGPLAYYGGPTQTIALLPGSPAIDKGSNALAVDPMTGLPLTTDQRGPGFLRIVNGTVDIGAYEFLPAASDTVAVDWGTQTVSLQTAADGLRLLPAGRNTDLPWLGINRLQVTLSQAQSLTPADVTVNSAIGVNYGPVTVSGSGTNYTITLAQPINAADRVTITIVNPGVSIFNRRLDVLPGDFNDDGVVNSQDLVGIRNQILGLAPITIFGDINGDGVVDIKDYNAVRAGIGTTLPPIT